jgi:pyoverdine/dityrosine biosynthesis protein Dit1
MQYHSMAHDILNILLAFERTHPIPKTCTHDNKALCLSHHFFKINKYVHENKKITFILPAFPAKSPNHEKTQSLLPDLGEKLSLIFLNSICEKISNMYSPGADIVICSDGRVFNDLVQVSDENVNAYSASIQDIIQENKLSHLCHYDLSDYYGDMPYNDMRQELSQEYAESLASLRERLHQNYCSNLLFNGMHRFVFEDYLVLFQEKTKNQVRQLSKNITYQLIQRSNAWSALLLKKYPDAVRLSIHPQQCGSEKLGIMLLEAKDRWATPWHRVVLESNNKHLLVRKKEAEDIGAQPIYHNNQFSHYVL